MKISTATKTTFGSNEGNGFAYMSLLAIDGMVCEQSFDVAGSGDIQTVYQYLSIDGLNYYTTKNFDSSNDRFFDGKALDREDETIQSLKEEGWKITSKQTASAQLFANS